MESSDALKGADLVPLLSQKLMIAMFMMETVYTKVG